MVHVGVASGLPAHREKKCGAEEDFFFDRAVEPARVGRPPSLETTRFLYVEAATPTLVYCIRGDSIYLTLWRGFGACWKGLAV